MIYQEFLQPEINLYGKTYIKWGKGGIKQDHQIKHKGFSHWNDCHQNQVLQKYGM